MPATMSVPLNCWRASIGLTRNHTRFEALCVRPYTVAGELIAALKVVRKRPTTDHGFASGAAVEVTPTLGLPFTRLLLRFIAMTVTRVLPTPPFNKAMVLMRLLLESLKNSADIHALRQALLILCGSYGAMARLDIVSASQSGKRQALCFLRMDSEAQELRMMRELGMGRFGGDLVLVVDLQPSSTAAQPAASSRGPSHSASDSVSLSASPAEAVIHYQGHRTSHAPHPHRLGNAS